MGLKEQVSIFEFESGQDILGVDILVRNYLLKHAPTLAHGYSHFKKVARLAFQLALKNHFPQPRVAYVAGLVHDLYRPAKGEAGQEKHEERTVVIAKGLLQKSPFSSKIEEIGKTILNHDEMIQAGKSTPLMEILSLADKSDMSFQRTVAYSWASNRYLKGGGKVAYTSFTETMRDFSLFQIKAWRVFLHVKVEGVRQATEAYLETNEELIGAVRAELAGKINYQKESVAISKKEALLEKEYLQSAGVTPEQIKKMAFNFSELL